MSDIDTKIAVLETNLTHLADSQKSIMEQLGKLEISINSIRARVDQWNGAIPRIADAVEKIEQRDAELTKTFAAHGERLQQLADLPKQISPLEQFRARANLIFSIIGAIAVAALGIAVKLLVG